MDIIRVLLHPVPQPLLLVRTPKIEYGIEHGTLIFSGSIQRTSSGIPGFSNGDYNATVLPHYYLRTIIEFSHFMLYFRLYLMPEQINKLVLISNVFGTGSVSFLPKLFGGHRLWGKR